MLRTSGEIRIGSPTGYNNGSSVHRPITRKMIRRSIFNMRSDSVMSSFLLHPSTHLLWVAPSGRPVERSGGPHTGRGCEHSWAAWRQDPQLSLLPTTQVGSLDAENDFERQRNGTQAHADQN